MNMHLTMVNISYLVPKLCFNMPYMHLSIFWKVVWILIIGNYVGSTTSSSSWSFTGSSDVWHATTTAKSIYDYYHITCCWSNWSPHGRAFQNWSQSNSKTYSRFLSDLAWHSSRQPGNYSSGSHPKIIYVFSFFLKNELEKERTWLYVDVEALLNVLACSWFLVLSVSFSPLLSFSFYITPFSKDKNL